ncbi:MAG: PEGA domain-containing protein [Polyangiaceae bacterium]|nr:PEGA domain-containing protein [Polyangiaceae bacterium]
MTLFVACAAPAPPAPPPGPGPIPARLRVEAPSGAEVQVDGIVVGTAPLLTPIDADPGPHDLIVTENGHHPHIERVQLERGKTKSITVDLDPTPQRIGAWVAIGAGAAGVATGVVFGVLAVVEDRRAQDLLDNSSGDLSEADQKTYDDAISARDNDRIGSGVAAGAGLALFVTGALLFSFDDPKLPSRDGKTSSVKTVPIVSPGFAGALTTVEF